MPRLRQASLSLNFSVDTELSLRTHTDPALENLMAPVSQRRKQLPEVKQLCQGLTAKKWRHLGWAVFMTTPLSAWNVALANY